MSDEMMVGTERSLGEIEQSVRIKTTNLRRYVVAGICDIGLDLMEAKEKCPHGQWGESLKRMGYSSSTASYYIQIYKAYGASQTNLFGGGNVQTFGNLDYSKALALLALPEGEREEFADEFDVNEMSVRELKAKIKEHQDAEAAAKNQAEGWKMKMEQAKADADLAKESSEKLGQELTLTTNQLVAARENESALRKRVTELEQRPVEVAVQTIDATAEQLETAEKKGRNAALKEAAEQMETSNAEWRKQIADLKAQIKESRRENENLSERNRELSFEADTLRQENGELTTERNDLQAQVNCMNADHDSSHKQPGAPKADTINVTFRSVVENTNKLLELLGGLDEVAQARVKAKLSEFFTSAAAKVKG